MCDLYKGVQVKVEKGDSAVERDVQRSWVPA